jgi:hypothetical protein
MSKEDGIMNGFSRAFVRTLSIFLLMGASLLTGSAQAQTLYKYIGADGKTVYSDKPPPAGVKYEKLQPSTAPTGVDLRPRGADANVAGQKADEAIKARQAKQAEQEQRIAELKRNFDDAVAALEAGKTPVEGERTQNANGTSRLNEDYFSRIAVLQQQVDDARDALEAARRE